MKTALIPTAQKVTPDINNHFNCQMKYLKTDYRNESAGKRN